MAIYFSLSIQTNLDCGTLSNIKETLKNTTITVKQREIIKLLWTQIMKFVLREKQTLNAKALASIDHLFQVTTRNLLWPGSTRYPLTFASSHQELSRNNMKLACIGAVRTLLKPESPWRRERPDRKTACLTSAWELMEKAEHEVLVGFILVTNISAPANEMAGFRLEPITLRKSEP